VCRSHSDFNFGVTFLEHSEVTVRNQVLLGGRHRGEDDGHGLHLTISEPAAGVAVMENVSI